MFKIKSLFKKKSDSSQLKEVVTSKPVNTMKSKNVLKPKDAIKLVDKGIMPETERKINFLERIKSLFKKKPHESLPEKKIIMPPLELTIPNLTRRRFEFLTRIKSVFKKKEREISPEGNLEYFKKKLKKEQQKKISAQARKQRIKNYLDRAGFEISIQKLSKIFLNIAVLINLLVSAYLIYEFSATYGYSWGSIVLSMAVLWIFVFLFLIFAMWILFYIAVDLKIFKRKVDIEEVLPDFLQLTASNITAGMTIDRALWFAVRPRFGVLAKEIETVAKETMGGSDLRSALEKFAARYDSVVLKRSISMLNEGIEAGGKIGDLLNRIAIDIQEQTSILKEMSANVTTYIIFITFATVVAAPFLYSMSGVLIGVVHQLGSSVGSATNVASSVGMPISFSGTGITESDFRFFSITSLSITSLFSAMTVSTIKKGNVKAGVKYIPIFIAVSLTIYIVVQSLAGKLISSFLLG